MKFKFNEKGQALVIALFFSTIGLLMILALLYMVFRGLALSGTQKRYQTALDAGYAGVGTSIAFLDSGLFYQTPVSPVYLAPQGDSHPTTDFTTVPGAMIIQSTADTCFFDKLFSQFNIITATWTGTGATPQCNTTTDTSIDPKVNTDMEYAVQGFGGNNFFVYAKIVDSRRGITAQRPPGGLEIARGFSNRTQAQGLSIQPQAYFYYTVEIQAQDTRIDTGKKTNETAQISFDYAY